VKPGLLANDRSANRTSWRIISIGPPGGELAKTVPARFRVCLRDLRAVGAGPGAPGVGLPRPTSGHLSNRGHSHRSVNPSPSNVLRVLTDVARRLE
jgi:hypothetical protein